MREQAAVPDTVIYRSDGASRGQGSEGDSAAGWGAAVWNASPDGWGAGPPTATARGFLGERVSNNVAEYFAVRECMRRASRCQDRIVMFEVDSMLVSRQLARHQPWACRSENLIALHADCVRLQERMSANGMQWSIRHIYREFNQVADALANQAVDDQSTHTMSAGW